MKDSDTFVKITNRDIYDELQDMKKQSSEQHTALGKKLDAHIYSQRTFKVKVMTLIGVGTAWLGAVSVAVYSLFTRGN